MQIVKLSQLFLSLQFFKKHTFSKILQILIGTTSKGKFCTSVEKVTTFEKFYQMLQTERDLTFALIYGNSFQRLCHLISRARFTS